jgi:hypothetical protein
MKKEEMDRIIKFELEYIPAGSIGSIQNKLRFFYNGLRRKGMAKGMTREESLRDAINHVKKSYPGFDPEFDQEFFKIHEKSFGVKQVIRRLFNRF